MKTLINALLMLVFFLLGLRMSGVVSKFAPFLVGSNQSSEVVIPNASENHENMQHEGQDIANMDQQAAPESMDPALAANAQPPVVQDQSAQQAPVPEPIPGQTPEAQAPQGSVSQSTTTPAPVQPTPAAVPAIAQKVETVSAPAVVAAPVKSEVKKAVSTKSSSKKK